MTVTDPDAEAPRPQPAWTRWAGLALVAGLLAGGGYVLGARSSDASVAVHHGTAVISPAQMGVTADGVSYDIPLDVPWKDSSETWHQGERPSCLPATAPSAPVTFTAVRYDQGGQGGYVVVWVDCSG